MILNISPNESGLVPTSDVYAYKKLGTAINLLNSKVLFSLKRPLMKTGNESLWRLAKPLKVKNGSFVVMEDVKRYGQQVERYQVNFNVKKNPKRFSINCTTIGHKRIIPFPKQLKGKTLISVSMNITKLVTNALKLHLKSVQVFDWDEATKKKLV